MTSALDARPLLRSDLKIVRREHRGRVHYVVKQPAEQKYFQFGEVEVGLMRLMNGERAPAEIAEAAAGTLGVRPQPGQVADFAQKLKRLGLVERTPAEQNLMLMEHLRSQRKSRVRRRTRGSILRLRFSIGDPDDWFARVVDRLPWFWSRAFVLLSLAIFAGYLIIVGVRWDRFWAGTIGLFGLSGFGPWDLVLFYLLVLAIGAVHELGHGLTTKRLGGEVHEIGAMILYFSPALYCNTNDAWTFERRADRLWVTFAGPWIEMVIAGLFAILWFLSEPGTFVHTLAFLGVLAGGISAVLANINPLIPLDGYYALSDWLEIPNLRGRAFGYWSWLVRRYLLGLEVAEPTVTPRERRILLVYGALAMVYSVLVIVLSLAWLILVLGRFVGPWIWLLLALIGVRALHSLAGRSRELALVASTTWRSGFLRGGRAGVILTVAVLVIGLPFVLPWTFRASGPFRVEAVPRATVRVEVAGVLDGVHVRDGTAVRAGAAIARLWNPELEAEYREAGARVERLRLALSRAAADDDLHASATTASRLETAEARLAIVAAERERLTVRAPIDGVVQAYRLEERLGEMLGRGDDLVEIDGTGHRQARVRVPIGEGGEVAPEQRASLKLPARADLEFKARVSQVARAAQEGWVEVVIPFPTGDWLPAPGMAGVAKIATRRGTIAEALERAFQRTLRLDLWL